MARRGLIFSIVAGCEGVATVDCEPECPTDKAPDSDLRETDGTTTVPPTVDLGPIDNSASGFVHLFHDALAVAWTPTRGGAAWGGGMGGDTHWPNPFGQWQATRRAPRAANLFGIPQGCVASADEVSCHGAVSVTWPRDWPRDGVLHAAMACAVFAGGEVRCVGTSTTPPAGPAARISARDIDSGCILATDGTPTCWAAPGVPPPVLPDTSETWAELGLDRGTACGIDPYGEAWCLLEGIDEPQSLGGRLPLSHLSVSHKAACAIDADQRPRCGDWDELPHPGIAAMPTLQGVTAISVAHGALCVVQNADTVTCWGGGTAVWRQPGAW